MPQSGHPEMRHPSGPIIGALLGDRQPLGPIRGALLSVRVLLEVHISVFFHKTNFNSFIFDEPKEFMPDLYDLRLIDYDSRDIRT